MLRYGCLVDPKTGGDFSLGMASEIIQGQAFVLPGGEISSHYLPHLAHFRADEARPLFLFFFFVAVVSGNVSGDNGLKNGGVVTNLLEAVVKPGHFSRPR